MSLSHDEAASAVQSSRRMKRDLRLLSSGNTRISTLNINPAQANFEDMLWPAFSVRIFSVIMAEWQIETVKKYATKQKEEIEHSAFSPTEKDDQKQLWRQWYNTFVI